MITLPVQTLGGYPPVGGAASGSGGPFGVAPQGSDPTPGEEEMPRLEEHDDEEYPQGKKRKKPPLMKETTYFLL